MEEKNFDGFGILKLFCKTFIIEIIITIIGLFVLAIVLSKTNVSDSIMGNVIVAISSFAISIGSFLSSRKIYIKGIIWGILQGIFYMLFLYVFSSIYSNNYYLGKESIIMIIIRYCIWNIWRNYRCKF